MCSVLSLWWSLSWRFALVLAVLFAISTAFNAYFLSEPNLGQSILMDVEFIKWKPTANWWMMAALLWVIVAASPRFLCSVVWGDRLRLDPAAWRAVGQALALSFVVLGLLNLAVWKLTSTGTWVNFKLFVPLPLLAVVLALVSVAVRGADRAP